MKRLAVFASLALFLPLTAHADDASRRAKAEELITLLHMDRNITRVIDNVLQQTTALTQRNAGGTLTPAQQSALSDFQKKLIDVIDPDLGWKAVSPEYVRLYSTTFTDEDLDGMLAFYKSQAGKDVLEKSPTLDQQTTQMLQARVRQIEPRVKQMVDEFEKSQIVKPAPSLNSPATPSTSAPPKSSPQ